MLLNCSNRNHTVTKYLSLLALPPLSPSSPSYHSLLLHLSPLLTTPLAFSYISLPSYTPFSSVSLSLATPFSSISLSLTTPFSYISPPSNYVPFSSVSLLPLPSSSVSLLSYHSLLPLFLPLTSPFSLLVYLILSLYPLCFTINS